MALFGMDEAKPCCCVGGCCAETEMPECITLELYATCCDSTVTIELCRSSGPPVEGVGELAYFKYTGTLTTNWCYSEPTENIYVLNSNVAVFCEINVLTGEREWYIHIRDPESSHTWHPTSMEFGLGTYRLILVSCSPLLLSFGGDAGCSGDNCAYTWEIACFIHGTQITTPGGDVAIETLNVGDEVFDAFGDVVKVTVVHYSDADVILTVTDEEGRTTGVTPEHPFLAADGAFVLAGNLTTRHSLHFGQLVTRVTASTEKTPVVNLTVSGSKTFIADGFAVHNKGE